MADSPTYPVEYAEVAGERVRIFCRHEYLTRRWNYKPGKRVLFVAPSQDGKTTLAFQLLKYTASPALPAYVLVMKPRDATPAMWTSHLGYREVPSWPPPQEGMFRRREKPSGYTIWPPHTFNVAIDNRRMQQEFSKVLTHGYSTGNCIIFADEIYGLIAELPSPVEKDQPTIEDQVIALSTRGAGMGAGLWGATQKPSGSQGKGLPGFLITNTDNFFFSRDPDKRSRDRYAEIGGVNPDLTYALVSQLRRHQFVGIDRGDGQGGPYVCVIDAR